MTFKHGINGYNAHRCRCEVCTAAKRHHSALENAKKRAATVSKNGNLSVARPLRIIGEKPPPIRDFPPTPVDDCGEPVGRSYCTHRLPCPHHPDAA